MTRSRADGLAISIVRNTEELWSSRLISPSTKSASHDLTVAVSKGDAISFVVHRLELDPETRNEVSNAAMKHSPGLADHTSILKVGTEEFDCGMVCHATSKTVVPLPTPGKTFSAIVGVKTAPSKDPGSEKSAVFSVIVDGKVIFKSDRLKGGMEGVPVNVDLGGASEVVLEVSDGGEGIGFDWAKWVNAKVVLADRREIWLTVQTLDDWNDSQPQVVWDPVITYARL